MSDIKVASRYAKSLLDLSLESNSQDEIKKDMELFVNTLKSSAELTAVIKNPIITLDKKRAILSALFGDKVSSITIAFFNIMVNKGRAAVLYGSAKEFLNQYNIHNNIVTVKVVSATPLTQEAQQEVVNKVKALTGGEIILKASVNESLIGGLILTIGDRQFDASVSNKLNQLKKEFSQRVVA